LDNGSYNISDVEYSDEEDDTSDTVMNTRQNIEDDRYKRITDDNDDDENDDDKNDDDEYPKNVDDDEYLKNVDDEGEYTKNVDNDVDDLSS